MQSVRIRHIRRHDMHQQTSGFPVLTIRLRILNGRRKDWNVTIPQSLRVERRPVIDIHDLLILYMYDEVGFTIAVDIADLAGDRGKVLAVAKEHWTHVDVRVCHVAAGNLNYLDVAVQVEQDKVRRMRRAITVAD